MYSLFTDYCHIEELEVWNKELAEQLRNSPKFFTDGTFNYRLKRDGFVFRIWKEDARTLFSLREPAVEKSRKVSASNQAKLLEVTTE